MVEEESGGRSNRRRAAAPPQLSQKAALDAAYNAGLLPQQAWEMHGSKVTDKPSHNKKKNFHNAYTLRLKRERAARAPMQVRDPGTKRRQDTAKAAHTGVATTTYAFTESTESSDDDDGGGNDRTIHPIQLHSGHVPVVISPTIPQHGLLLGYLRDFSCSTLHRCCGNVS
jgi:hypothetical protein